MMHDPDPFTERLQAQPPPALSPRWRDEILAAALPPPSWGAQTTETLIAWLWPRPLAWSGLAGMWLLILVLKLCTPSPAEAPLQARVAENSPRVDFALALDRERLALNTLLALPKTSREGQP